MCSLGSCWRCRRTTSSLIFITRFAGFVVDRYDLCFPFASMKAEFSQNIPEDDGLLEPEVQPDPRTNVNKSVLCCSCYRFSKKTWTLRFFQI